MCTQLISVWPAYLRTPGVLLRQAVARDAPVRRKPHCQLHFPFVADTEDRPFVLPTARTHGRHPLPFMCCGREVYRGPETLLFHKPFVASFKRNSYWNPWPWSFWVLQRSPPRPWFTWPCNLEDSQSGPCVPALTAGTIVCSPETLCKAFQAILFLFSFSRLLRRSHSIRHKQQHLLLFSSGSTSAGCCLTMALT